jgi:hypothetical protein
VEGSKRFQSPTTSADDNATAELVDVSSKHATVD